MIVVLIFEILSRSFSRKMLIKTQKEIFLITVAQPSRVIHRKIVITEFLKVGCHKKRLLCQDKN